MCIYNTTKTTHPGCVDHTPGIHQAKPMLMTVGKSSFIPCPQCITFVHLYTISIKSYNWNCTTARIQCLTVQLLYNHHTLSKSTVSEILPLFQSMWLSVTLRTP